MAPLLVRGHLEWNKIHCLVSITQMFNLFEKGIYAF